MLVGIAVVATIFLCIAMMFGRSWLLLWRLRSVPGTRAFRMECDPHRPHEANLVQLKSVIELFLHGDAFDMLWVSWTRNEHSGVMLTRVNGPPVLSTNFKTHRQQPEMDSFIKAMNSIGLSPEESSTGFNGGLSEKYRITILRYAIPVSADGVIDALAAALTNLSGTPPTSYFVKGSGFSSRTPGENSTKPADPLAEIFDGATANTPH